MKDDAPPQKAPETTSEPSKSWAEFRWYMGGHGSYFAAMGVQGVVYPYIVTFVLVMPADMVGLAQMFTMLPMFGLVLLGGLTADRRELRIHLMRLQVMQALPMFVLAALAFGDRLTFTLLILCGVATGCVGAFVMPARDSLLNRVARRSPSGDIQQAVTMITGIQFAAQLVGIVFGRAVSVIGPGSMLFSLALIYIFGAFCTTNVKPAPPNVKHEPEDDTTEGQIKRSLREIKEGLMEVRHSERMFPVVMMIFCSGLLIMGVFSVLLQMLIRDVYEGDIGDYASVMMSFTIGITLTTTIIMRRIKIVRQGRAMMLSFLAGACILSTISLAPPLEVLYALIMIWGGTAGISMSMSRSIVQEAASDSHRARVMSVYQLGFLGGAPLGSLMMGIVTDFAGPLNAALIAVGCMLVVWMGMYLFTGLWKVSREVSIKQA